MANAIEDINNEISTFETKANDESSNVGILKIRPINQVIKEASERPDPKKLWLTLWYEGECCCLFADSNVGKSIYALMISEAIARSGEKVLYFDFELSDKMLQARYEDDEKKIYHFSSNLYRVEINPDSDEIVNGTFDEQVMDSIENAVQVTGAKILVIDNLSYILLNSEKGDMAGSLMMRLIQMKRAYGLSMLILAHTPKRSMSNPITQNDLAGSKRLFNFFDSVFAIGKSVKDSGIRYIKQIKVRYGDFVYNEDNVIVATIEKENGFTKFVTQGYSPEREHLKEESEDDAIELAKEVKRLKVEEHLSIRDIARRMGLSKSKVDRILKK